MARYRLSRLAYPAIGAACCIIAWESASRYAPALIPGVREVVRSASALLGEKTVRTDFAYTVLRTLAAFFMAVGIGTPVGLVIGWFKPLRTALMPPLDFLRSIPAFVLLPCLLALLKESEATRIAMASIGAGLIMVAYTAMGAARVRPGRMEVAKTYGAGPLWILVHVVGRELLPQVLDGIRLAVSLSLVLVLVSEIMLGARFGVGTLVNDSLAAFDLPRMYGLVLLVGGLGYALNLGARALSSRLGYYGRHL